MGEYLHWRIQQGQGIYVLGAMRYLGYGDMRATSSTKYTPRGGILLPLYLTHRREILLLEIIMDILRYGAAAGYGERSLILNFQPHQGSIEGEEVSLSVLYIFSRDKKNKLISLKVKGQVLKEIEVQDKVYGMTKIYMK